MVKDDVNGFTSISDICFMESEAESKEKHGWKGPFDRADYNLTLGPLQSRLQHIYHGQPYARETEAKKNMMYGTLCRSWL
jgi:hypothetical protein